MFGYVTASVPELSKASRTRYLSVYCGICRRLRGGAGNIAGTALSYDMAFLAILLMSLYEPEEERGSRACALHPVKPRPWVDNVYIRYAADMNIALAYYNCMDDYRDEGKRSAKAKAALFEKALPRIREQYPRQCAAIEGCLAELDALEKQNCADPDIPAGCFGKLLGQLFVYEDDLWSPRLRQMGDALGRFVYLADAAADYRRDRRKKQYNPFLAAKTGKDPARWEQYLVLAMGRCTRYFEQLPLVQDKEILDNILYSGVWLTYRRRVHQEEQNG